MLDEAIFEAMIDFAELIEILVKQGWKLGRVYGERRYSLPPKLTITRGEETHSFCSSREIEDFLLQMRPEPG